MRMAYDAGAASSKVSREALAMFEALCVAEDQSWYVQHAGLTREALLKNHTDSVLALLPRLGEMLDETGAEQWATAPMLGEKWGDFLGTLPKFTTKSDSKSQLITKGRL